MYEVEQAKPRIIALKTIITVVKIGKYSGAIKYMLVEFVRGVKLGGN
jgi:hypothetical protein